MAGFERKVRRILQDHDCTLVRESKGDHENRCNPHTGRHVIVYSKIKSRHTANAIMK